MESSQSVTNCYRLTCRTYFSVASIRLADSVVFVFHPNSELQSVNDLGEIASFSICNVRYCDVDFACPHDRATESDGPLNRAQVCGTKAEFENNYTGRLIFGIPLRRARVRPLMTSNGRHYDNGVVTRSSKGHWFAASHIL